LTLFKRNPKEFLHRLVTVDETWIHWYTPETKEQSKQWTSPGEPAPKKAKTVPSAGKVMATVFWDSQGVIYIDYLEKGKTVIGLYYAELILNLPSPFVVSMSNMHDSLLYLNLLHNEGSKTHTY